MSRAQLPYSPTEFHQIRHEPYRLPTDFENVPDSGTGMSKVQLPYSSTDFHQFDMNPTLFQLILKMYLIQVQVCPKSNFLILRPIFIKFDMNPTLIQLILKMYLIQVQVYPSPASLFPDRFPSNST